MNRKTTTMHVFMLLMAGSMPCCVLLAAMGSICGASVSTNVPLGHWGYGAIDKLSSEGLIDSAMLSTKPFSRLEMARLISEADQAVERRGEKNRIILSVLDRLQQEFRFELDQIASYGTSRSGDYIKPIEDPYLRFLYGREPFDLENQSGDRFDKGSNVRLGFASRMSVFDKLAFYIHPEYRDTSDNRGVKVVEAYSKSAIGWLEVEVGKDSLWWGPGYHGSTLMSNNAENFTMFKVSNPEPIQLPWLLKRLGPFKAVYFLTQLEDNRDHPDARLTGLRLSMKPHPIIELGVSRTAMFGGEGLPSIGASDYLSVFGLSHEQTNNNQLAGLDLTVLLPCPDSLPLRTIKVYADMAGEDEAGYLPSKWGGLYGILLGDLFKTGRTDLRLEYADNHIPGYPNVFYTHSVYTSGYTYKGRTIGHFMGTDAEDLLVRLTHYITADMVLGIDYDRLQMNLSGSTQPVIDRFGADLMWFAPHNLQLQAAYRYEKTNDPLIENNHIFDLCLRYNY